MLYVLVRCFAPTGAVVELGAWKGRSTLWLGSAVRDRGDGPMHSIDTWQGTTGEAVHRRLLRRYDADGLYREFVGNIEKAELGPYVRPWRMTTQQAAAKWEPTESIGLLFIDADHSYEAVKADFDAWSPFVAPGGFIVFDDVPSWPGPTRMVSRLPEGYDWVLSPPSHWVVCKGDGDRYRDRLHASLKAVRGLLPRKSRHGRWRKRWRKLWRRTP